MQRQFNNYIASTVDAEVTKVWPGQMFYLGTEATAYFWFVPNDGVVAVAYVGATAVLQQVTVVGTGSQLFTGLVPGQYEFRLYDSSDIPNAALLDTSPQWTVHEVVTDGPNALDTGP